MRFDPNAVLKTLDRHRVTYIVIGSFARVIQGAQELTRGIDIVPSTRPEKLRRLEEALGDLHDDLRRAATRAARPGSLAIGRIAR